ncbi:hypothetical protein [Aquisphaera giovannonii]|uniref:hypothetical protein n=1 Tax=Aquisphaera giovannonii TaxID=406548 RepID=UPI0011E033E3|nr:hypothetical protein [Aquisphaera giovannonii]
MGYKVIEGTWEEVTRNGRDLAGHRVRVTVLDDAEEPGVPDALETDGTAGPLPLNPTSEGRSPGPFLEEEAIGIPFELPRLGTTILRSYVREQRRLPDLPADE